MPVAAFLVAAAGALAGCSLFGGAPKPQPPAPAAQRPPAAAPATPLAVKPLPPAPAPSAALGNKIGVALIVPLSGANAPVGQAILDAAQMALFDLGGDRIELLVRDSGGTPQMAAAAARSAIAAGAQIILGPLLAGEVEAAKPVAAASHVSLIAFSSSAQLAGNGTWLMSFDPRQEIERVVLYAHNHGRNNFAALAPQSPYGDLAVTALRQAVDEVGASLGKIARYDPGDANPGPVVQDFAAGNTADAVLLPDGGARVRTLAPLLPFYGLDLDKVKLLGTGLWADATIGAEPSLDGAWYAAPNPAIRADFEKRFGALYNHPPPFLATLGYDAMALAAVLAKAPNGSDFSSQALTNPSGFSGLNGIFRLLPNGLVERRLAILEVHRDGPTVIDPAPQSFQPGT